MHARPHHPPILSPAPALFGNATQNKCLYTPLAEADPEIQALVDREVSLPARVNARVGLERGILGHRWRLLAGLDGASILGGTAAGGRAGTGARRRHTLAPAKYARLPLAVPAALLPQAEWTECLEGV